MNPTEALREVERCERAISQGSPLAFWIARLQLAIRSLNESICILSTQRDRLTALLTQARGKEAPHDRPREPDILAQFDQARDRLSDEGIVLRASDYLRELQNDREP